MSLRRFTPQTSFSRMAILAALTAFAVVPMAGCRKKTPDERLQEATKLIEERQTARGVIKLKELIRDTPQDPAAWEANLILAQYYTREGNGAKALECLEVVRKSAPLSDPRGMESIRGIFQIRRQLGDYEGVIKLLDGILADPKVPSADSYRLQRAQMLLEWGSDKRAAEGGEARIAEAVAVLREMMIKNEDASMRGQAREQLAAFYRQQRLFEESNGVYTDYLAAYPEDPIQSQLHMAMAVNFRAMGNEEKAASLFEPAAEEALRAANEELDKERRGQMLLDLAFYHEIMGHLEKAEELMRRVMGENTRSMIAINTQFGMARMYVEAGKVDRGIEILEQIRRENPGSSIEQNAARALEMARKMKAELQGAADGGTSPSLQIVPANAAESNAPTGS